jgi:hypothetical protein
VLVAEEAPPERKKAGPEDKAFADFTAAWWFSGAENPGGFPYLSRSAWMAHLAKVYPDKAERTLRNKIDPSRSESLTAMLIQAGIIDRSGDGYQVISDDHASQLNMAKSAPIRP